MLNLTASILQMPPSPSQTSPPAYPRHSSNGSRRSRQNSSTDARLSIIVEDGNPPPPRPQKAHYFHRPFNRHWNLVDDDPPRPSFDRSPPQYSLWDATGRKGVRLWEVRKNHRVRRRGGWKRTILIAFVVTIAAVALAVGLVVGLKKNSKSVEPLSPSQSPSSSPKFPAGSYTFQTYLISVTTNCSSSPLSWTCLPFRTYSESPSDSVASYQWIIIDTGSPSSPNLTISSSDNPFNIDFANASLSLLGKDSDSERYTFTANFEKRVPLLGDKSCFYSNASLKGTFYTKRAKSTTPAESSTASTALNPSATADIPSDKFAQWRYAVDATVSASGGSDVPACYHMNGADKGAQYSEGGASKTVKDVCSCEYKNYNL